MKYEKVEKLYSEGASKNEVKEALYLEGVPFSKLDKVIKDQGWTWRGRSNGWRELSVEAFIKNPQLSLDEYITLLEECGKKQPEVAGKYFYPMLSGIAKGLTK